MLLNILVCCCCCCCYCEHALFVLLTLFFIFLFWLLCQICSISLNSVIGFKKIVINCSSKHTLFIFLLFLWLNVQDPIFFESLFNFILFTLVLVVKVGHDSTTFECVVLLSFSDWMFKFVFSVHFLWLYKICHMVVAFMLVIVPINFVFLLTFVLVLETSTQVFLCRFQLVYRWFQREQEEVKEGWVT